MAGLDQCLHPLLHLDRPGQRDGLDLHPDSWLSFSAEATHFVWKVLCDWWPLIFCWFLLRGQDWHWRRVSGRQETLLFNWSHIRGEARFSTWDRSWVKARAFLCSRPGLTQTKSPPCNGSELSLMFPNSKNIPLETPPKKLKKVRGKENNPGPSSVKKPPSTRQMRSSRPLNQKTLKIG